MSLTGKWRIIEMPDYVEDYPDMVEPAYILFEANGSGEFAFGCVTGHIWSSGISTRCIDFSWDGNDEMDRVQGDGDAELQDDGSLHGQIRFHNGDEADFIARRDTSSTAC